MNTPDERKDFLLKLRIAASEADDILTSCDVYDLLDGLEVSRDFMFEASCLIEQLESRLAQAEQDAKEMANDLDCSACTWCEYKEFDYTNEACRECRTYNEGFKLRGVCEENTKEERR